MSKMSELAARKWDTYWTEAERAGLKAMGRCYLTQVKNYQTRIGAYAIRSYVTAARKVKEGQK